MKEKYPVLIGHSARACKKLFTMEQVADFICEQGLYGEVTIETPEGLMLMTVNHDVTGSSPVGGATNSLQFNWC